MKIRVNGILRDMTAEELSEYKQSMRISAEEQIVMLKQNLADTDYKAIKTSEKFLIEIIKVLIELCEKNDVDVADVKSVVENYSGIDLQRQEWRNEINRLESEVVTDE